jgi:hypothetical protein
MIRTLRAALKGIFGIALGCASAYLVDGGNPSILPHHRNVLALVAALIGLGAAVPYILSAGSDFWLRANERLRGSLQNVTDTVRETLIFRSDGLFTLKDVGVHIWVIRRRSWPPWRFEAKRLARSTWSSRSPNPHHDRFQQDWRTGKAPKIVGQVWTAENLRYVDMVKEYLKGWRGVTEKQTIERLKESSDFSAIWVSPTQSPGGMINGFIGVNVEAERLDGHQLLEQVDAGEVIHDASALAGRFISPDA